MKVLNRPMFRYGGPIKEGIMSGIKEPKRQGYATPPGFVIPNDPNKMIVDRSLKNAEAFKNVGKSYDQDLNNQAFVLPVNKIKKPTDTNMLTVEDFTDVERIDPVEGLTELQKAKLGKTFIGTQEYRSKVEELEALEKANKAKAASDGTVTTQGKSPFAYTADEVIKNKGKNTVDDSDLPLPNKKERVNTILESLGYDRAQKNALYDAMIKAGQRISRTGLSADNLVSDVIAETSQSYDKPEKLREAANLMDVQQQLKLDQIEASKTGGTLKQNYDFYISQGDSPEVAEKKARNLPTTISEKFNASKSNTDSGKVYNVTMELTQEGFFGDKYKDSYNGRVAKKYKTVSEFIESEDFKGDGVYNFKGEAFLIENGKVTKRQIIQPKVDKEGFFS